MEESQALSQPSGRRRATGRTRRPQSRRGTDTVERRELQPDAGAHVWQRHLILRNRLARRGDRLSPETDPTVLECVAAGERGLRRRWKVVLSVLGALVVTGVLGFVLAGHRAQFVAALHSAPISLLAVSVALQIVALLSRSRAWNVCVRAAGGGAATPAVPRGRGRLPRQRRERVAGHGDADRLAPESRGIVRLASRRCWLPRFRSSPWKSCWQRRSRSR
jgi:hypothetical protein